MSSEPIAPKPYALAPRERHDPSQHDEIRAARGRDRHVLQFGMRSFIDYADVEAILSDPRFRESGRDWMIQRGICDGPLFDWWCLIMFTNEGATHRRLRSLVSRAFAQQAIERMRPLIASVVETTCDRIAGAGEIDVVEAVSHIVPIMSLCDIVGVPRADVPTFDRWSIELGKSFAFVISPELRGVLEEAIVGLSAYVKQLIADRRRSPQEDLVSRLIAARDAEDRLDEDELVAMVANLLLGGHDTTKSALSCLVYALLRHPAELRRLHESPMLAPRAVEEVLRYESPVSAFPRVAVEDVDMRGVQIAKDEMFLVNVLGANRDPARFTDPDRFDITRTGPRHLGFGVGAHYCIGAPIARLAAQETILTLLRRFPEMELVDEEPTWTGIGEFRAPASLRVRLGPVRRA